MLIRCLAFVCLMAASVAQAQTTLRYQWKPNTTYRYSCTQVDEVNMGGSMGAGIPGMPAGMGGMMAMGEDMKFTTTSTFALQVQRTTPNGGAAGMFYLESFRATDASGRAIATLASIPKGTLRAPFTVDELGNFEITQIPVLIVDAETGNVSLTVTTVKDGEMASAEAVVDGERVRLHAEFTKSGTLRAGYTVSTVGTPKAKTMEVQEDDEVLDLVPTDFLEMFVLPEQPVQPGKPTRMAVGGMQQTLQLTRMVGSLASLRTTVGAAVSSQQMQGIADEADRQDGIEPDHDDEAMPNIAQETQADITTQFDNSAGRLQGMSGTISTQMHMMGMEITHKGTLQMRAL